MSTTKDEITRMAILDAARALFQQFGLAKTTMEDIAKAIGKGKSSLYYYYDTKEEIFQAVVDLEKMDIEQNIIAAVGKETNACEKFKAFAHTKYRALRKRQLLYKFKNSNIVQETNGCIFDAIKRRYNESEQDIVKGILLEGIKQGTFSEEYIDRLETATLICTNMLRGMQMEISFGEFKGSAVDLIDATVRFMVKALRVNTLVPA